MTKVEELARELMQQETIDIKRRQASLLQKTAEGFDMDVDPDNITKNQGHVQSTFRKNY